MKVRSKLRGIEACSPRRCFQIRGLELPFSAFFPAGHFNEYEGKYTQVSFLFYISIVLSVRYSVCEKKG